MSKAAQREPVSYPCRRKGPKDTFDCWDDKGSPRTEVQGPEGSGDVGMVGRRGAPAGSAWMTSGPPGRRCGAPRGVGTWEWSGGEGHL